MNETVKPVYNDTPIRGQTRNLELECYRILATAGVIILHFSEDYTGTHGIIPGGYLGVDFLFMLSGYFLMTHWMGQKRDGTAARNTAVYFLHRLKRIYPPFLVATILMQLIQWAFGGFGIRNLVSGFWSIRWQFFLSHFLGAPTGFNMRSVWYLSSLVLLTWLIYYLIDRNLDLFLGIVPVVDILIFVYISRTFGTLSMQDAYSLVFNGGLMRGFAEMTTGAIVAYIVREIKIPDHYQRYLPLISATTRICSLFLIGFITMFRGFDDKDFVVLPAMILLLVVAGLRPFGMGGGTLARFVLYLGRISYWVYLLHLIVSLVLVKFIPGKGYWIMLAVFLLLTTLAASGAEELFTFLKRRIRQPR